MSLLVVLQYFTDHVSAQIDLGTAASFGVIASSAITNTGATIVTGSLGLSPNTGSSITGFPPGLSGDVHAGDAVADQARQDARTAYNTASSLASTSQIAGADLGGQTLVSGVYTSPSAVGLTGTLTLDGQNDADSLFVFQIGSTLTTASSASVVLVNGARACNVFFQIGSSATLGSSTTFNGNILALTSISLLDGVSVTGGLYAVNGAVTLINDRIVSQQECVTVTTSTVLVGSSTEDLQTSATDSTAPQTTEPGRTSTLLLDVTTSPLLLTTMTPIPSTTTAMTTPDQPDQPNIPDIPDIPDVPVTESLSSLLQSSTSTTPIIPNIPVTRSSSGLVIVETSSKPVMSATTSRIPTTVNFSTLSETTTTKPARPSKSTTLSTSFSIRSSTLSKLSSITTRSRRSLIHTTSSTRLEGSSRTVQSTYPISSSTPTLTSVSTKYRVYTMPTTNSSTLHARSSSGTQSHHASMNVTSSAPTHPTYPAAKTTEINGTACTTITYYEPTCACTQTTIVPVAYTPGSISLSPDFTPATVTTVSGIACTTASYYEQECDCVLNTHVPLEVVTETARIHTVISSVPYVTSKHYETGCGCVKTATVPVRIASPTPVGETATDCGNSGNTL